MTALFRRRVGRFLLLGLGLLLVAGLAALDASRRYEAELTRTRHMVTSGRFHEARRWLAPRLASEPVEPEIYYMFGLCEYAEGRYAAALEAWRKVPRDSPFGTRAALASAQALLAEYGRFAAAEPLFEVARRGTGQEARLALEELARLGFYEGRYDEMRALLEGGWSRSPDRAGDLRSLWKSDFPARSIDEIRARVEEAASLDPNDDRVWLARANLAILAGLRDDAKRWLDACGRKRPDDAAVWRVRLRAARAFDDPGEARRASEHLPASRFTAAETLDLASWLARGDGRIDDERKALEQLVAIAPAATEALERLALLASEAGRKNEAAAYRRRKTDAEESIARYSRLLEGAGPTTKADHLVELAGLAETLGRHFEARGWWTLAVLADRTNSRYLESMRRLERHDASPPKSGKTLAESLAPHSSDVRRQSSGDRP